MALLARVSARCDCGCVDVVAVFGVGGGMVSVFVRVRVCVQEESEGYTDGAVGRQGRERAEERASEREEE